MNKTFLNLIFLTTFFTASINCNEDMITSIKKALYECIENEKNCEKLKLMKEKGIFSDEKNKNYYLSSIKKLEKPIPDYLLNDNFPEMDLPILLHCCTLKIKEDLAAKEIIKSIFTNNNHSDKKEIEKLYKNKVNFDYL